MMLEVFGARHPTVGSDCVFDLRCVIVVGDRACFERIEEIGGVNRHTQMLATLWNEGARILRIEDRDEREHAMNPIFEQISQVVNDFSVEISNAHLLVEDDRLNRALNHVNEAALLAIRVAEDLHDAVVEGRTSQRNPFPPV